MRVVRDHLRQSTPSARRKPFRLGWFHRYPARFHAAVLRRMFTSAERHSGRGSLVILDPFCGTGATVSAARQRGHRSIGIELSHLGLLIARVRLSPPVNVDSALDFALECSKVGRPAWYKPVSDDLVDWIGIRNAKFLSYFLMLLDLVDDERERSWLELAMSSALRSSSVWLPGSIKPQVDPDRRAPDLRRNLRRAARRLALDCAFERASDSSLPAFVLKGSATNLPLSDESVDAIITSPPYESMYDYFDVQRLSYLAFSWPVEKRSQIGRATGIVRDGVGFVPPDAMVDWYVDHLRGEETIGGRALRAYLNSLDAHLREAFRVVRPGGSVSYAVANSIRFGRTFPLVDGIKELMTGAGFEMIRVCKRKRPARAILPTGRNRKTGRFSSGSGVEVDERIIYARRP